MSPKVLKINITRENTGLAMLSDIARLKRSPDVYALGFVLGQGSMLQGA